jgi:hypothetical protein
MKSLPFSLTANVAGVFPMSSKLTAGDHNERDFSVSEAASATRAVQEFMGQSLGTSPRRATRLAQLSQEHAFFIASDGHLVFESGEAAQQGLGALEQSIERIALQWGSKSSRGSAQ